jgi:cytoskeletal protein CcmA (bactofilin family)
MLKASSLLYALFISLIIGMVCVAFILTSYYNDTYFATNQAQKQLVRDVHSGIQLLLSNQQEVLPNETKTVALFEDEQQTVTLKRMSWGVYEVLNARSEWKNKRQTQTLLCGIALQEEEPLGLYMTDLNKPLSLCGTTVIKGKTALPKAGVKRAYIEGQHFVGKQLINGSIGLSANTLPNVNELLVQSTLYYLENFAKPEDSVQHFHDMEMADSIVNSFDNRTLLLHSNSTIRLSAIHLKGNIIVRSEHRVEIASSCTTEDILVYAPEIIVEEGFSGSLQLYVSDSMYIAPNCSLFYPSSLALNNPQRREKKLEINIDENCLISGALFLQNNFSHSKSQMLLRIGENTTIEGQVYCNAFLELKGKVHGPVFCKKFLLKTPSSIYENHLLNAEIDPYQLSKYFVGIPLLTTNRPKKVVKWLY